MSSHNCASEVALTISDEETILIWHVSGCTIEEPATYQGDSRYGSLDEQRTRLTFGRFIYGSLAASNGSGADGKEAPHWYPCGGETQAGSS